MQKFLLVLIITLWLCLLTHAQWQMNPNPNVGFVDENLGNPQERIALNPEWLKVKEITMKDDQVYAILEYQHQGDRGFLWRPSLNERASFEFLGHDFLKVFDSRYSLEVASVPVEIKVGKQEKKKKRAEVFDFMTNLLPGKNGLELLNGAFAKNKVVVDSKNLNSKVKLFHFRKEKKPAACFSTLTNNVRKTEEVGGTDQLRIDEWSQRVIGTLEGYLTKSEEEPDYIQKYTENSIVGAIFQSNLGLRESKRLFNSVLQHVPKEFIDSKKQEMEDNLAATTKIRSAALSLLPQMKAAIESLQLFALVKPKTFQVGVGSRMKGMLESPIEPFFQQVPVSFDKFAQGFKLYPVNETAAWNSTIWAFKTKLAANLVFYWSTPLAEPEKPSVDDQPLRQVLESLHQTDTSPFSQAEVQSFIEKVIKSIFIDFSNPIFELMYYFDKMKKLEEFSANYMKTYFEEGSVDHEFFNTMERAETLEAGELFNIYQRKQITDNTDFFEFLTYTKPKPAIKGKKSNSAPDLLLI